ncbi:MAG: hypothetical protein OXB86_00140, partial [Bdellovibrionales bacterium]|nr:hypothetical protein [Bdellovibrionales bacterium]
MIINLPFLICLLFSFKAFPAEYNNSTEATFNVECTNCKKDDTLQFFSENQDCLKIISSKECKDIPKKERRACSKEDEMSFSDTGSFIVKCIKDTALSYKFIFDLLWYSIQNASSWLLSSNQNSSKSSSKSYILIEFYKAYLFSEGTTLERLLKAASLVGGKVFNSLWSTIKSFLKKEHKTFQCYKLYNKLSIACSFVAGLVLPGASFFTVLKVGGKVIKAPILHTKLIAGSVKNRVQLKAFTNTMRTSFKDFKKYSLKRAGKLPQRQKQEIRTFFRNINQEQFMSAVKESLTKNIAKKKDLTREQIRKAVLFS